MVADYHALPRKDVVIPVYETAASELIPVSEPAIVPFKADEAVVAAQAREQLEATSETITRLPFEAFAAAAGAAAVSKPRTAFEEAAAKLSLPLKKKRFPPPSAKLLAKLKEKKLKKDEEGGQKFASVLHDQVHSLISRSSLSKTGLDRRKIPLNDVPFPKFRHVTDY